MGLFLLISYFLLPLFMVVEFVISMVVFKRTDKSDPLWKSRKKRAILFGILSVIFVGGAIAIPFMLSYFIARNM